jgi:hypothetical protein
MKRILLLAGLFTLVGGTLTAGAYPRNSLTVEPLGLYFGEANVEFEHVYERQMAYAFRANFVDSTVPDWTGNGVGVGASLRFFPIAHLHAPKGLWFGPSVDATTTTFTYHEQTATALAWGVGGDIGYKFLFGHSLAFVISPFASVRYWGGSSTLDGAQYPRLHGATVGLGASVGLAF